mmetsp:Transcript_25569/g.46182  ORF Transcript_25569/g.46182 Transcript_25569/m.46182 type:complete len:284 (+) Transcript_25569:335-1186(+)
MGICISTAQDAVDDFLDGQSRYYKESKQAKEHLGKQNAASNASGNASHISAVLQSDLSPIYPSLPNAAQKYHCRNVYDGDTLTLEDGSRVRLLGIDTPELKEKQPFALEAKEYSKKYCHEKDVWLTFQETGGMDNEKNKDHYKRILAFIWVPLGDDSNNTTKRGKKPPKSSNSNSQSWLCINEGLVASGLAHSYSPSRSKKVHCHDKLLGLQKVARVHKIGQWKSFKDYDAIVTPTGSAFHKCKKKRSTASDCKHLARSKNLTVIAVSEAYDKGLHPCRNCFG